MPRRLLMNKQDRDRPAIIAPPPLLMVVCVAAGLIAAHFWPLPMIHDAALARAVLCVALIVVAGALIFSGHREMVKNNEHPNPYKPTSTIVQNGIYGFTRNPLYISLLLIVLVVGIGVNDAWLLSSFVALFVLLHFGVVKAEERYLSAKFGSRYDEYRRSVRRWL
jgi:protein-S-isoprenylcysteine O-methyltransferase Ste14